jgi:glycosyltransferase involved in cell wall biosynthesis
MNPLTDCSKFAIEAFAETPKVVTIKPLIVLLAWSNNLSGGYNRLYQVLKRGKSNGINYVLFTDQTSYDNFCQMFSDFGVISKQYIIYLFDSKKVPPPIIYRRLRQREIFKDALILSNLIAEVAQKENVDLIINPSEGTREIVACYLASIYCSKPWTAIFQPGAISNKPNIFDPLKSLTPLNARTLFTYAKRHQKTMSMLSAISMVIDFLLLVKISERTKILTVSNSVVADMALIYPKLHLIPICPGNGIELSLYQSEIRKCLYNGIYFARMLDTKGFLDLAGIWKLVVQKIPNAQLAVCGIAEDKETLERFQIQLRKEGLKDNVHILGKQEKSRLIDLIAGSDLTLNPSYVDSFSLVTLESLACATPVVAYDISALRHNFKNCRAVLLSPVGDKEALALKIIELLESSAHRQLLGEEGKKFAQLFDWESVVKAEKQKYIHIIESKK